MTIRTDALDQLPVRTAVPELRRALETHGAAVLCAPPGTGKTTLVPLALAGLLRAGDRPRRVLVAEPRRIAARAAARRMAWLLGEEAGDRVGFTVRGERRVGRQTLIEVVTTGVLLQRLQRDQELAEVDAVMLDECHERHLDADTAAAFLLDIRATLRPELWLLAASATTDAAGWAKLLGRAGTTDTPHAERPADTRGGPGSGRMAADDSMADEPAKARGRGAVAGVAMGNDDSPGDASSAAAPGTIDTSPPSADGAAPIVTAAGISYTVDVVWAPPARAVRPAHGMRVDPVLLDHVAAVVRRALRERDGDVLCFLPGVGEIGRVAGQLGDAQALGAEVLRVHGRAPAAVQDAVLAGGAGQRRVVLATSVAESSLTVPGVRVVVDAGLAREPRTDHARGLSALATVRASRAATRQRAGRAGREAPGTVYRCWSEADDARLPRWPSPEITVADLAAFALQCACWGDPDATGLALLDPPPSGAMAAAREVLTAIGAVGEEGRVTGRGTRMARLGLHPRLARALIDGAREFGPRRAAEVVALLSEEPPREYGDDLAAAWRAVRRGGDAYAGRWRQEARRLAGALQSVEASAPDADDRRPSPPPLAAPAGSGMVGAAVAKRHAQRAADSSAPREAGSDDAVVGLIAALAFPERVARARGGNTLLMASGTGAELAAGSTLGEAAWLAIAVADRPVTAASARVRLAAVIDEDTARTAASALHSTTDEIGWAAERRDVVARRVERLGRIELRATPLTAPDPARIRAGLLEGLRREGLELLRWSADARTLRQRMAFAHRALGEPWPDVSNTGLLERAEEWLAGALGRARGRTDLERVDAGQALARLLPWASGDAARFDELVPERIEVPSGSRIRVDYAQQEPVLAVKLQELFGWQETPRIAGGRVPVVVHLLSPAGRPAAVTADLASFWREGYRSVRAELRGRYPKHPWPEDPTAAAPTRHTSARSRRS
ncbi:ATP-dependent helicase HrpB [Streptomyces zagrosensis]|uniref:ATP-dependent helicase HrpB n=1 Tax=Streptomyces zagrosensis TaxID=1042984 RepID=A0A7W9Q4Y1_9ACTN|nr:ATP-dependent helicase C-terminal domain-containing protein [Streptomyces zagrosensis]MBB5933580.1 ATP-dependent helicase HrpB [Streptomyces zagrosensis]